MNKTTLKARFGSEMRKNWIHHSNDISLNDLVTKMQRYFDIKDPNTIKLKYRDEENDWITLADDDDLSYALASLELLFVDVIVEEQTEHQQQQQPKKDEDTVEKTKADSMKVAAPPSVVSPVEGGGAGQQRSSATPLSSLGELTEIPLNGTSTPPVSKPPIYHQPQQPFVGGALAMPQQQQPQQTPLPPPPVGGMFYGQPQHQQNNASAPPPPMSSASEMYHQHHQQQQPFVGGSVAQQQQPPFVGGSAVQQQQPPQQAPLPPPPVGGTFYGQNPFSRQNR